jgi:hypothetical protein
LKFSPLKRRKIEAEFSGGDITTDAGALLLREVDKKLHLCRSLTQHIQDPRRPELITHQLETLIRQRIFAIALAYEDVNDHDQLRKDAGFKIAVSEPDLLASSSTLCRLEQWAERKTAIGFHQALFKQFIKQFKSAPKQLILDFDATDDPTHGNQVGKFYHGYYRHECFLPLHVYCGHFPLVSYLRPSWMDPAKHTWAILSLLVKALRKQWPEVEIIFRGDGGFCRDKIMRWCERHRVKFIIGLGKNEALYRLSKTEIDQAALEFERTGEKQRIFNRFLYKAGSWKNERVVIVKAEHTYYGDNPRYIVTNLSDSAQSLYEEVYCARGEMENRIKEIQLDLFADRTSCHEWWPNQLRLLFSSFAYVLVHTLRSKYLSGTKWAKSTIGTLRLKLLKVAAVVIQNTRRIRFLLSSHYVYQSDFQALVNRLNTS